LLFAIDKFVPVKKIYRDNFPKWGNRETRLLIKQKKIAHKQFKTSNLACDYEYLFSDLRKRCKEAIKNCRSSYISNVQQQITGDTKLFWNFVNLKKTSHVLPSILFYNKTKCDNVYDILNAFASHFESAYTVSNDSDERVEPNGSRVGSDTIDLNYFDISVEQIISKMKNLELAWTPGSDGIPSGFINLCADSLVFPLKIIFNKSLSTGAFPLHWKTADIIPIHKSGSKTVVENYRGISIMSVFPKILDSIVSDVITNTVKNIIIDEQHGLLKGKSTTTNLFFLQNMLSIVLKKIWK
jgi:hypothetical protein